MTLNISLMVFRYSREVFECVGASRTFKATIFVTFVTPQLAVVSVLASYVSVLASSCNVSKVASQTRLC